MASVLTFGETMALVRAAELGTWETSSAAHLSIGGADSNVAIGLSRLGVTARWIGRVGDDSLGRRVRRELRAEGLEVHAIVDPTAATGLMLKERPTPMHGRVLFYRSGSAGSRLSPEDIADEDIGGSALVLVNGITASLSASARDTVISVIDRARARGVTIAFDVNHRPSLWRDEDPRPLYRELAGRSDIVFAGVDEAQLLVGDDLTERSDLARAIADLGPRQAIIKDGAHGAVAISDADVEEVPAVRIDPVDTVGAGDAFVAGYLASLLDGDPLRDRLLLAVKCGAFACLGPGDWESLPRREDLRLFDGGDPVSR